MYTIEGGNYQTSAQIKQGVSYLMICGMLILCATSSQSWR